jgi:hypothetical protein
MGLGSWLPAPTNQLLIQLLIMSRSRDREFLDENGAGPEIRQEPVGRLASAASSGLAG